LSSSAQSGITGLYGNVIGILPDSTYFQSCHLCLDHDTIFGTWGIIENDTILLSFDPALENAYKFSNHTKVLIEGDTLKEIHAFIEKSIKWYDFHSNGTRSYVGHWNYPLIHDNLKKMGTWQYYHENGQLKKLVPYQNGLIHGRVLKFDENGGLIEEMDYVKGIAHGQQLFYFPSGALKSKRTYVKGELNGLEDGYFETQTSRYRGNWKKGLKDGVWTTILNEGTSNKEEKTYKKGVEISSEIIVPDVKYIRGTPEKVLEEIIDLKKE